MLINTLTEGEGVKGGIFVHYVTSPLAVTPVTSYNGIASPQDGGAASTGRVRDDVIQRNSFTARWQSVQHRAATHVRVRDDVILSDRDCRLHPRVSNTVMQH